MIQARYVYIAGRGHSGSTLLEMLLGGHPKFVCAGELQKLSLQLARREKPYPGMCSCGRRPFDCERWKSVLEAIRREYGIDLVKSPFAFRVSDIGLEEDFGLKAVRHWAAHNVTRSLRQIAYSRAGDYLQLGKHLRFPRRWVDNRLFVAGILREATGASAVVDSSKDALGMRDLAAESREPVRVIYLTRDPRSSVYSTIRRENCSVETAARDWVRVNDNALSLLRGMDRHQWLHVTYEQLCADASATCARICEFLGYTPEPRMLDLTRAELHTIGGNRIRYKPIGAIKEDDQWRQHLAELDVRRVQRIAGNVAHRLGYGDAAAS